MELAPTMSEIKTSIDGVASWAKTEKAPFSVNFAAMRPTIRKEPKGVVLIIAPFNYPVWLLIGPLAGALAAGNTVLLKPSEQTPAVSSLLTEAIHKYLDNDLVRVVNGAIPETTKLLELQWDYILYTGGERVGRIVATAAAKHTTPVSLELGGKSPVIIDPNCDLPTAAKRILWGKGVNAGQTCVAPDYILVPESFQDKLVDALKVAHSKLWPSETASFPHLISDVPTKPSRRRSSFRSR
jgi:aldehyde dehydrogenase (NAD+)